jgi:hypothetical protein
LHSLGVESLILTGTVTQILRGRTGREAFHYGYKLRSFRRSHPICLTCTPRHQEFCA